MFFKQKLKNKNEPILEPIFRELRFGIALKDLRKILNSKSKILDFGCGPEAKFQTYLKSKNIHYKSYFGYDPLRTDSKEIVVKNQQYDLITLFAVLEHLSYPDFGFDQIIDRLKVGGYLLLTTPTKLAEPVLEFLSYKLGIVSRREIEEHQHYFDLKEIGNLFSKYGLKVEERKVFEIGMNNYVLLKKKR